MNVIVKHVRAYIRQDSYAMPLHYWPGYAKGRFERRRSTIEEDR